MPYQPGFPPPAGLRNTFDPSQWPQAYNSQTGVNLALPALPGVPTYKTGKLPRKVLNTFSAEARNGKSPYRKQGTAGTGKTGSATQVTYPGLTQPLWKQTSYETLMAMQSPNYFAAPAAKTAKSESKTGSGQTQSTPVTFDDVYNAAKALGDPHPNVVAAQWADESGWGKKQSGRYNYFGIKGSGPLVATHEYSEKLHKLVPTKAHFQNFKSLQDGLSHHTRLVNSKQYPGYSTGKTDEAAIDALVRGGYANRPTYKSDLMSIIRKHGVGVPKK